MEQEFGRLFSYFTKDWRSASYNAYFIEEALLKLSGFSSMSDFMTHISGQAVSVSFFAGAGARWVNSIIKGSKEVRKRFNPLLPRCLAPVKNCFGSSPKLLPVGVYALLAVKGLCRNIIIYRDSYSEIEERIADPLGMKPAFVEQKIPIGEENPLGHGDAAIQVMDQLKGSRYVVTNFAGDSNSRKTVILALLVMHMLEKQGKPFDLVLPATMMRMPKYPILLEEGLPVFFGQSKLKGDKPVEDIGLSNVGIRVYRTEALLRHLGDFKAIFKAQKSYASINNGNNELALDNIDGSIAKEGKAIAPNLSIPEEIQPMKTVDEVGRFEAAMCRIKRRDSLYCDEHVYDYKQDDQA